MHQLPLEIYILDSVVEIFLSAIQVLPFDFVFFHHNYIGSHSCLIGRQVPRIWKQTSWKQPSIMPPTSKADLDK